LKGDSDPPRDTGNAPWCHGDEIIQNVKMQMKLDDLSAPEILTAHPKQEEMKQIG
jgi:hypothetical protein